MAAFGNLKAQKTGNMILNMKILKKLRNTLLLWRNSYRGLVRITFEKGLPRLHIHEKNKSVISWSLRMLILVGIATSVINFPWYLSLGLSVVLVGVEQFFERAIFMFSSLFVNPLPEYKSGDWEGMLWGVPALMSEPFTVGIVFHTNEVAKKIFPCLLKWNYDNIDDRQFNNVCISVVIEDDGTYSIYIHPGIERPTMKEFFHKMEEENKGKEHYPLIMSIIFCRSFDLSGSNFDTFRRFYKAGHPFFLKPFYMGYNGTPRDASGEVGYLYKEHLKILNRQNVEKWEDFVEFNHGKFVMEL